MFVLTPEWREIEEYENGVIARAFAYGDWIDEVLTIDKVEEADCLYYHSNAIGSIIALTDETGAVPERYSYDAYGEPSFSDGGGNEISQSAIGNSYLFTARRYDKETGLYYYRTRYPHPKRGRFVNRDMIGIWGDLLNIGNPYTYVGNNPLIAADPTGLTAYYERQILLAGSISKAWIQAAITCDSSDGCKCDGANLPQGCHTGSVILYGATCTVTSMKTVTQKNEDCPDCKMECREIIFDWMLEVGFPTPWGHVGGKRWSGSGQTLRECADGSKQGTRVLFTCTSFKGG